VPNIFKILTTCFISNLLRTLLCKVWISGNYSEKLIKYFAKLLQNLWTTPFQPVNSMLPSGSGP